MHRQPLLHMLNRYAEKYPAEGDVAQRIERLVSAHADCFERSCRPGHITGSAWVLSHDRQRCVLVHHRKLDRWLQPGGHADGQSDVAEVARLEAQEETGLLELEIVIDKEKLLPLDIDVHLIPKRLDATGREVEDTHEHHDIRFLLLAAPGHEITTSDESHDARWFTHEEVLAATDEESVLRMLRKAGPQ